MFSAPYISSIPVSLLLAIFETVGDEPVVWNKRDPVYTNHHGADLFSFTLDRSVRPPPQRLSLTISHVCSQWRYLVTGEARLWAAIVVNSYNRGDAFLVALSLSRSKNHLLRLALLKPRWSVVSDRHLRCLPSTPVTLKAFLSMFLRHISHWEYINFNLWWDPWCCGSTDLFNMVSVNSAKSLKVAILPESGGKALTPSFYHMWEIFYTSPQLCCAAWNASEHRLHMTPPFSCLRGLDVHVCSIDECLTLLRSCIQLESLYVTVRCSLILHPLRPVTANNLRIFTLDDSYRHCHYSRLLDNLTLPALRHLDIMCFGRSRDEQPHRGCLESIPDMLFPSLIALHVQPPPP
ncbi:hypothetical protein FISHEDRAFT_78840 [Fistulina hepatica ATCC 64428]|uniref:Uncharacterized protein n=1 Tax=Fistulina hepatica ATCC 64428 TaxID=1128425 RepID=A0A0D7A2C3_9AGAR|nr:hypothetical protein FISHEDRAFT_78840 [Fistulina hepatica ATCC 64428]